jgi:SAM-dependent methyltransferase
MHPVVHAGFIELLAQFPPPGERVLEIGAGVDASQTLLSVLAQASDRNYKCVGIDPAVEHTPPKLPYDLRQMSGNDMHGFDDNSFDAIICNATLEHDRMFWRTLAEVRRVLQPGGLFYVGVPGYPRRRNRLQRAALRPQAGGRLGRIPGLKQLSERARLSQVAGVGTLWYHAAPRDYYRFSEDAVRDVFLEGMDCLTLRYVLWPVRILAVGSRRTSLAA